MRQYKYRFLDGYVKGYRGKPARPFKKNPHTVSTYSAIPGQFFEKAFCFQKKRKGRVRQASTGTHLGDRTE